MSAGKARERWRLALGGTVQGVGFRPGVFRLASSLGLGGWAANSPEGAVVEIEGDPAALEDFRAKLLWSPAGISPLALPVEKSFERLEPLGEGTFAIHESVSGGNASARLLPDIATCEACLAELFDPSDRRFRYPFLNCAHCGPRFSIVERLPYDRANTAMKAFPLCGACLAEYNDPADRRFHAQPVACPDCGPRLEALGPDGRPLALREKALALAEEALRGGLIVALKGLGGFQLLVDARDEKAVRRLRERKRRPDKPFAVLFPSMESAREACVVSPGEESVLRSPWAPILLIAKIGGANGIAPNVAPGVADLGAMLPYTPLHRLIMSDLGFPIVATSGNRSGEPIYFENQSALENLGAIADFFLTHDRPIVRRVDDSVARIILDMPQVLRLARGFAPLTLDFEAEQPQALAVGARQKNAVAVSRGKEVMLSQHVGDLETPESLQATRAAAEDLSRLQGIRPSVVVRDLHPDYESSQWAETLGLPIVAVQHHEAHVLACAAEWRLGPPFLGVAWDGAGLGRDGTIWGGEFFLVTEGAIKRVGTLRPFRLPGGDAAIREPRRAALGLLAEWKNGNLEGFADLALFENFAAQEIELLNIALKHKINSPLHSSMGRLFDALASILGVRQTATFEGQAAMELETLALEKNEKKNKYRFELAENSAFDGADIWDWAPIIEKIIDDWRASIELGRIVADFHAALAELIVRAAERAGEKNVALSGGCFQNRLLTEIADARLREAGFKPFWPRLVPPNDGGIALGQVAALARMKGSPDVFSGARQNN